MKKMLTSLLVAVAVLLAGCATVNPENVEGYICRGKMDGGSLITQYQLLIKERSDCKGFGQWINVDSVVFNGFDMGDYYPTVEPPEEDK